MIFEPRRFRRFFTYEKTSFFNNFAGDITAKNFIYHEEKWTMHHIFRWCVVYMFFFNYKEYKLEASCKSHADSPLNSIAFFICYFYFFNSHSIDFLIFICILYMQWSKCYIYIFLFFMWFFLYISYISLSLSWSLAGKENLERNDIFFDFLFFFVIYFLE